MPTYRNDSSGTYNVDGQLVAPGDVIKTVKILPSPPWVKIDDKPYFNPVAQRETVLFADAGAKEVLINEPTEELTLVVRNIDGCNIEIYFETTDNTPSIAHLQPGQVFSIDLQGSVNKIVFVSDGAGSFEATFWKTRYK